MTRVFGPLLLVATSALAACGGKPADLDKCDQAIKQQLKAPATYQRVDAPESYQESNPRYTITYDAQNSFGVPLRSTATCYLDTARTSASAGIHE